jgi:7-cyano-7-deazaguanine synthase
LQQVQGSFSIAAADCREPQILHLARNFQPLVYQMDAETGALWFASFADYLHPGYEHSLDPTCARIVNGPPYTYLRIDGRDGRIESCCLSPKVQTAPPRTLVVASGGLDSTVVATLLHRSGREVTLLHFQYGCHAELREAQAVRQVAQFLGVESIFIDHAWLGRLGASALTEDHRAIAPGREGAELPREWVPARNMEMISQACCVADAQSFDFIALGTNLEEGGAYPDNTQEFIQIMNQASSLGTRARAVVEAPVGNLVKHEIVRLGLEVGAPLHLTWSCYRNGPLHCGQCGPCFMRKTAFRMNGVEDPLRYLDEHEVRAEPEHMLAVRT